MVAGDKGAGGLGKPTAGDSSVAVDSSAVAVYACGCWETSHPPNECNRTGPQPPTKSWEERQKARLEILNAPTDYSVNRNRLSNARFPLGEEPWPDVPGTDGSIGAQHVDGVGPDDKWFNLKIEQHLPKEDPKQKHLLHGGPELRINCDKCGKVLHIAGEKPVREVLEGANYYLDPERDWKKINTQTLVVACCESGHVTQFRGDVVARLVKRI